MTPNHNLVLISDPTLTSNLKFDDQKNCEWEKFPTIICLSSLDKKHVRLFVSQSPGSLHHTTYYLPLLSPKIP